MEDNGSRFTGKDYRGNIDLEKLPKVHNPDGGYSTVASTSFSDGKNEILIPTVFDGKHHTVKESVANYYKTGRHLGIFNNIPDADMAGTNIHNTEAARIDQLDQQNLKGDKENNMWPAIAAMAAAGLLKSQLVDAPKAERQRKLAAETAKYSPWTGMSPQQVQEADPFGSMLQGAGTGAMFGQMGESGDLAKEELAAKKAYWEKVGGSAASTPVMAPSGTNPSLIGADMQFKQPVPYNSWRM